MRQRERKEGRKEEGGGQGKERKKEREKGRKREMFLGQINLVFLLKVHISLPDILSP